VLSRFRSSSLWSVVALVVSRPLRASPLFFLCSGPPHSTGVAGLQVSCGPSNISRICVRLVIFALPRRWRLSNFLSFRYATPLSSAFSQLSLFAEFSLPSWTSPLCVNFYLTLIFFPLFIFTTSGSLLLFMYFLLITSSAVFLPVFLSQISLCNCISFSLILFLYARWLLF